MDGGGSLALGRVLAVWALLAGIAVMHVLPASHDCPEAGVGQAAASMPMAAGGRGSADHGVMRGGPTAGGVELTLEREGVPLAVGPTTGGMAAKPAALYADGSAAGTGKPGTVCSATPPSRGLAGLFALFALGLLIIARPMGPGLPPASRRGPHRRAPPRFGALLLNDLCVSRT
ncbi:putative membrane protein [Frankia canadensis]|uniref:Putative membrane protein n=1 Tax=Frankia canadensis TaxID=1836972 RepID=A0A2I2KJT8_9ACTN|nr:hypothetical protein [Frankia canadensis]SNQ45928.1 putative membrane protein [Frankia canadensis]SOU53218.1 putative membrane protein [Frankia canadensis]